MPSKALAIMPETAFSGIVELVINGLDSQHSRRGYTRALMDFLAWFREQPDARLDRRTVSAYIALLRDQERMAPAYINLRLTAIRRLVHEAAENSLIDWTSATAIERLKGVRDEGRKTGVWLTKTQVEDLLMTIDRSTVKGVRDAAILTTLIGTGLRREELCHLTMAHIQQREGRWAIINIVGKRNKTRSIPMASWNKRIIDQWTERAGITSGILFRAMRRGDHLLSSAISPQSVFDIVRATIREAGLEVEVAPHDLRRTFAKLAHQGGASIEQISLSLGHESIETTQLYIGLDQSFGADAPCDKLGIRL